MNRMTVAEFERLKKNSKVEISEPEQRNFNRIPPKRVNTGERDEFGLFLQWWCNKHSLELQTEQRFHVERQWRLDYKIPALGVGIEYNGIFSEKSRHTTPEGYTADLDKANNAQVCGLIYLQFTKLNKHTAGPLLEKIRADKMRK